MRSRGNAGVLGLVLTVSLLLLASPARAQGECVLVFPFEGAGVHPDILISAGDGLALFLRDEGYTVINAPAGPPLPPEQARASAAQAGAHLYVTGRVVKLGRTAIVEIAVHDLQAPAPVWTDRLSAGTPEDLEPVLQRLAKSVATRQKATELQSIHTVTEKEAAPLRRERATNYFGVHLGGAATELGDGVLAGGGVNWMYDARKVLFDIDLFLYWAGAPGAYGGVSIGAYAPLADLSTTPYLGGGLELTGLDLGSEYDSSTSTYADNSGSGLSGFVAGGVIIGRTSTVHLRIDLRGFMTSYDVGDGRATGLLFSAGIAH